MHENKFTIMDFDNRRISLPTNEQYWEQLYQSNNNLNNILLLGTANINPKELNFVKNKICSTQQIYWMESPEITENKNFNFKIFNQYDYISGLDLDSLKYIVNKTNIYFYKLGLRINPRFWSRILAEIDKIKYISRYNITTNIDRNKLNFFVPGNSRQLIHDELLFSIKKLGHNILDDDINFDNCKFNLIKLSHKLPDIFLSINLRGLDPDGRIFNFYKNMNIPVIIWLVDNPYNILSSIKLPWWKEAYIYVTDPSFIAELERIGAINVKFLPLAASWHMFVNTETTGRDAPLFIGRSEFPDKGNFFKGIKIDIETYNQCIKIFENCYNRDKMPDYHWWVKILNCGIWPRDNRRKAAFGAETISKLNRLRWIKEAIKTGLRIYGDSGWTKLLPETNIHKPVDYYGCLPTLYGNAQAVLNVTSCLLPQSLNQRHFDVWASGGFLLTDKTKGLNLFPTYLTEPISLNHPQDFSERLDYFNKNINEYNDLKHEWYNHILNNHTYENRINTIINDCIH